MHPSQKQVSAYDKLVIDAYKCADTSEKAMLENDIDGLTELISVETTNTHLHIANGRVIVYDRYVSLFYGAA